jgi:hypothetical protein
MTFLVISPAMSALAAGAAPGHDSRQQGKSLEAARVGELRTEVTSGADAGPGTLRAAIAAAGSNPLTVTFAADLRQIDLASPIDLTGGNVTIAGPGADRLAISGLDAHRIFTIGEQAEVAISGLTLSHGKDLGRELGEAVPGGPGEGGAIYNSGRLVLKEVALIGDRAVGGGSPRKSGGPGRGGAVYNAASARLRIEGCRLVDDRALGGDKHDLQWGDPDKAGGPAEGGAIFNEGELRIDTSEFSGDAAIGADGEFVLLFLASRGSAGGNGFGGAIFNGPRADTLRVDRSTFAGDQAIGGSSGHGHVENGGGDAAGGAIYTDATLSPGQMFMITASTMVDDSAALGFYQGRDVKGNPIPATLGAGALEIHSFSDATIVSDTIVYDRGEGDIRTAKPPYAANTIFGSCAGAGVRSFGGNLDYGTGCKLTGADDLSSTDAMLTGLGENGGPTRTDPPAYDSPAIDVGSTAEPTDQRGLTRPVRITDKDPVPGNYSDIGAVELQHPTPQTRFVLEPDRLTFGAVAVGTVSRFLEVSLDNTGDLPFDTGDVKIAGEDLDQFNISSDTCAGSRLQPGTSCRVRVRFSPEEEGAQSAEVRIDAKVPGGPLTVPLAGTGS